MSSSVPDKWSCDIILSHYNNRLSKYLSHESNRQYETFTDNENIDRGLMTSKCYVTTGMGGTIFNTMRYKGWVGGQNGQI